MRAHVCSLIVGVSVMGGAIVFAEVSCFLYHVSMEEFATLPGTTEAAQPDVLILRLEIDDLCTLPQCSAELLYKSEMAVQGDWSVWYGYCCH